MTSSGETVTIETDWRPVLWSLLWAWSLSWIPSLVMALRTAGKSYTVADDAVTIRTGLVSKHTQHVELYRVRNVSSSESAIAGGKVVLAMHDGTSHMVGPIKNADQVGTRIRAAVTSARSSRNVQNREDL
ncbi:PH domain-containing protein [Rathayibacter toxicus]|uniref:PH domain-containing protein n=1 Tax=Rathayibacter toxicus TaxID=145458 RepID=UPI000CE7CF82|nr:PH domain-containing protein [Rathayibacter toxicus]PPI53165.1 hypothetical protein C5D35_09530 [Rathayibacter toxicus]QOD10766.1 PH domain-containing protein [Rathayibacter toxicus]QWL27506.1 PH domain-containing protein [Rathayibacter toxicus]QWL31718.1 PH domain-containing protein [Rathayibacter toxicus]QWL33812.1 PH domain-containing protein [Rathayibacter toxicus]